MLLSFVLPLLVPLGVDGQPFSKATPVLSLLPHTNSTFTMPWEDLKLNDGKAIRYSNIRVGEMLNSMIDS
jgi:hypothetical protein